MQNSKYLLQYQIIKQEICKNKMCANYNKVYIFEKLLTRQIQISLQYFHKLNLYSRKTENVQIFFKCTCEKSMQNSFANTVQSPYFCSRLSKRLYNQAVCLRTQAVGTKALLWVYSEWHVLEKSCFIGLFIVGAVS